MASPVSHALVAVTAGMLFPRPRPRGRYWMAAILSILPDIDVLGYFNGVEYGSVLGHRGLTHSLAFAAFVSGMLVLIPGVIRPDWGTKRWNWLYLFFAVASHGRMPASESRSSRPSATRGPSFHGVRSSSVRSISPTRSRRGVVRRRSRKRSGSPSLASPSSSSSWPFGADPPRLAKRRRSDG